MYRRDPSLIRGVIQEKAKLAPDPRQYIFKGRQGYEEAYRL